MKQGGRKRSVAGNECKENADKAESDDCLPSAKRRKVQDREEKTRDLMANSNGKRWSAVETDVESEILEDMGVKMLDDEEDANQKKSKPPSRESKTPAESPQKGDTQLQPNNNDQRLNDINEEFFLFRRKQPAPVKGQDVFSKLSDEMVLMIFRWLPKNTLVRCSLVCKRWQRIAYDEVLWTRMDLGSKTLKPGSLGHLLNRGSVILRLAQAEIANPVFMNSAVFSTQDLNCKLQYLDLSMAVICQTGLRDLLDVCRNLRKLSLEHCTVNKEVCAAIGKNQFLEVLNMSACYGITHTCLSSILSGCLKLSALNIAWTSLTVRDLDTLCDEVPRSMQRLNISGCRKNLSDDHVKQLVLLCPDLVELDLSDCTLLTSETIEAVCGLEKIEYLALSRCYSISASAYIKLRSIDSLMYLDVFNLMSEESISSLQQSLVEVDVNKFLFSSVARPTVGIRRTSIWGLRVRD